jgi:glucosamine--fructose-6-phosphate aminotransferase (isomerizing)
MAAMCGIVGYTGARPALGIVVNGLRRLEYRGYDSAGVAVLGDDGSSPGGGQVALLTCKRAGKLGNLEQELAAQSPDSGINSGTTGVGHTRWATHGGPTDRNAHPHRSTSGRLAVIHNGILENFARLRAELEGCGVEFTSDTDTECAAHLLERELDAVRAETREGDAGQLLAEAMRRVCRRLEGAFTLLAVDADTPGVVVGARRNSPLVVGRGEGENFLASDVSAFIAHTREAIELGQDQVVLITPETVEITDFDGAEAVGKDFHVDWDASAAEKDGYDYFMLKEIAEQPRAVADTLRGRMSPTGQLMMDETRLTEQDLRSVDKVFIVACGTAYHAGLVAKYAIEHWTRLPCEVELASEFRYRDPGSIGHIGRRYLPIRRDHGHADGGPPRAGPEGPGARDLQYQRLDHPARVRRRAVHPRRTGGGGRIDEGVPDPAGRLLPGGASPGPGPRSQVRRRGGRRARPAEGDAGGGGSGA